MNVCYINSPIEYYSPISGGAIATVTWQTTRELIARGHRVSILTPVNGDQTYPDGKVVAIRSASREGLGFLQRRFASAMARLNQWDWPFYWYYVRSFSQALKRLRPRPDVVIVHNDLVAPKYVKRIIPEAKVMVVLHNEQRTNLNDLGPTLRATDRFLAVSGYIKRWTTQNHPIDPGRIEVIPNGIDLGAFKPREGFAAEGAAAGPVKALFIGRIDPNKGPDIAVDAVARLRAGGLAVSMTVAGGLWFYGRDGDHADPYLKSLKEKMASCGAEYLGHVARAKVPELVRAHDVVFVLSRSNEPFGLVTLEAMASGCAVIASNRGGLPEACGTAAILHDPDDFEGIVASLRSLVTDPAKLRELKRKSVARAASASWAATVDRLEPLLKP